MTTKITIEPSGAEVTVRIPEPRWGPDAIAALALCQGGIKIEHDTASLDDTERRQLASAIRKIGADALADTVERGWDLAPFPSKQKKQFNIT